MSPAQCYVQYFHACIRRLQSLIPCSCTLSFVGQGNLGPVSTLTNTQCSHPHPSSPHPPQYEPELFPGLIYRMKVPKVVLLIFVSGKVVLTGEPLPTCLAVACSVERFLTCREPHTVSAQPFPVLPALWGAALV